MFLSYCVKGDSLLLLLVCNPVELLKWDNLLKLVSLKVESVLFILKLDEWLVDCSLFEFMLEPNVFEFIFEWF